MDTLLGGDGDDTIKLANGDFVAGEVIDGGAGLDTLLLVGATTVDLSNASLLGIEIITGSAGDDLLTISADQYQQLQASSPIAMGAGSGDRLTVLVEGTVDLSGARPLVTGLDTGVFKSVNGGVNLTISGTALDSLASAVTNSGVDLFSGSTLNLTSSSLFMGAGLGMLGSDTRLKGVTAISAATSANGVNINLSQQSEAFTVTGSAFNDTLYGGLKADTLTGGGGEDVFVFTGMNGTPLVYGGSGTAGTLSGFDVITDYRVSPGGSDGEILRFTNATPTAAANVTAADGVDSTLQLGSGLVVSGHTINAGMIRFLDSLGAEVSLQSSSDAAAAAQYLQANDIGITGSTVAFTSREGGTPHTYVFQQGTDTGSNNASDTLIRLNGIRGSIVHFNSNDVTVVSTVVAVDLAENIAQVTDLTALAGPTASYTISGGADASRFVITGGQLRFASAPDYETDAHAYEVNVTSDDGVNTIVWQVQTTLAETNDNAPVITTQAALTVAENTPLVAALTSTDADTVGTNPANFSITGGADAALFEIVGGNLVFVSAPDFEADAHGYAVEVTANDGVHNTVKTLNVTLTDANDVAAEITTDATLAVAENTTMVTGLTSTDTDTVGLNPATFTVSGGADEALFAIENGNLVFRSARDFETDAHSYTVEVTANDGVNDTVKSLTVTLTETNDVTPQFQSGAIGSVLENAAVNAVIYDADAVDLDSTAPNNTVTYSLSGTDAGLLNINNATGEVTLKAAADYETKSSYSFTVEAMDGGAPSRGAARTVVVSVIDVNEAVELAPVPSLSLVDTIEDDAFASVTGNLTGTDPENAVLTYGIAGITDVDSDGMASLTDAHGTLRVHVSTGAYEFTPLDRAMEALGAEGNFSYTVSVTDGVNLATRALDIHVSQSGATETLGADNFNGAGGSFRFAGLAGDDTYVIDSGDSILEADGDGTDTVQTDISYTLDANLENLTLTGRASNGTGNGLDNVLTGNSNNNTLSGGAGNDTLNGGLGTDTLLGGTGDDTYVVDALDKLTELAGEGVDTVQSNVAWTLGANLDNLLLTGTGHIAGTGNSLDNVLTGNNGFNTLNGGTGHDTLNGMLGNDTLNGGDGNDTLSGGLGNDILNGGLGNDTYQMMRGQGTDTITDVEASANTDVLWFNDVSISSDQLWFRQTGADLEVAVIGTTTKALVKNWFGSAANQIEEIKAGDGLVLLNTEVQNLVSAMAAFSTRPAGSTSLTVPEQAALTGVLAANWS